MNAVLNTHPAYVAELRSLSARATDSQTLTEVLNRMPAGDYMAECIRALATGTTLTEETRRTPGLGYWPIPMCFPLILANTLVLLERKVVALRTQLEWDKASKLVAARQIFVQLACSSSQIDGEPISDLSGDHCKVFLEDHPQILELKNGEEENTPWWGFCHSLLGEKSAFRLMGAISDDEQGSVGEQHALVENNITAAGTFFRVHTIAEVEHEVLARELETILLSEPGWAIEYQIGKLNHRLWYADAVGL